MGIRGAAIPIIVFMMTMGYIAARQKGSSFQWVRRTIMSILIGTSVVFIVIVEWPKTFSFQIEPLTRIVQAIIQSSAAILFIITLIWCEVKASKGQSKKRPITESDSDISVRGE
jgi:Na+/serine symporter